MADETFFTVNILPSEVNRYDTLEDAAIVTADWLAFPAGAADAMVASPYIGDCYTFVSTSNDGEDWRYEVQVLIPNQAAFPLRLTLSGFRIGGTVYPFDELNEDPEYGNSGGSWTDLPHGLRSLAAVAYRHNQTWTDGLQITFVAFFTGPVSGTVPATTISVELLYRPAFRSSILTLTYGVLPPYSEWHTVTAWGTTAKFPFADGAEVLAQSETFNPAVMPWTDWNPDIPLTTPGMHNWASNYNAYRYLVPDEPVVQYFSAATVAIDGDELTLNYKWQPRVMRVDGVSYELDYTENPDEHYYQTEVAVTNVPGVQKIDLVVLAAGGQLSYSFTMIMDDGFVPTQPIVVDLMSAPPPMAVFWTGFVNSLEVP